MDKFKFIDWAATISKYNYTCKKLKPKDLVIVKCPTCNDLRCVSFGSIRKSHGRIFSGLCSACAKKDTWINNTAYRSKQSIKQKEKMLEVWNRPGYRDNQSKKHIATAISCWQNQEYRNKVISSLKEKYQNNPELVLKCVAPLLTPSAKAKSKAAMDIIRKNPEYHKKLSEASKQNWLRPGFREAVIAGSKVALKNPVLREILAASSKRNWKDPKYRKHAMAVLHTIAQDKNHLLLLSQNAKSLWMNLDMRKKITIAIIKSMAQPSVRKKLSESSRANWQNAEYRNKMIELYASPEYKAKASAATKKLWLDPVYAQSVLSNTKSKQEDIFAEFLDNNSIEYKRQFLVGPWSFDFFLPQYSTLVEINGDYFHKQPKQITKDASKATYISEYHSQYTFKTIWEHEFLTVDRIQQFISELKTKPNIKIATQIDFKFSDVKVDIHTASDCVVFFSKYHYTANGGRQGINITCYYNNILIACARFCNPTRAESSTRLKLTQQELRELTRFAIHPSYQKKNFASWFLSRCIKIISKNKTIKCLLTFADQTHNHNGTIYKASNWICDGIIPPDYYYIDIDGFVIHKRTLWGHAKKMCMSELEYAEKFNYFKCLGKSKIRYLYWIN
jgi:very-short-patch-repair endonuclease